MLHQLPLLRTNIYAFAQAGTEIDENPECTIFMVTPFVNVYTQKAGTGGLLLFKKKHLITS